MVGTQIKTSYFVVILCGLVVANVFIYREVFAPRVLVVSVFSVGSPATGGRATLLRTPNGTTLLIDTGPDASILRALGTALPVWQRRIDTIILTNAKTSSVNGLPFIISRYRVSALLRAGTNGSKSVESTIAAAVTTQTDLRQSTISYGTPLTTNDRVSLTVLKPGIFTVRYGAIYFSLSSSTPPGVYVSDGKTVTKTD